jgi:hypothetical protein
MNDPTHYDIIGDIHGRFDKLSALMERMGYARDGDGFIPPAGHKALFLGDLIDPKPGYWMAGGVRSTLLAVKAMCDRGDALSIMGNHELNAIYFHSKDPDGKWMRHHGDKNVRMHQGTLDDFPDHKDPSGEWLSVWIPWMKNLPFFLDLFGIRAVHATWHPGYIEYLRDKSLNDEAFFLAASDKGTPEGDALETLLKGVEVPLPHPYSFTDHTKAVRYHFRARWWEAPDDGIDCHDLVFPANPAIPKIPVDPSARGLFNPYPVGDVPVFFGHYLKPGNSPLLPERGNVACLDHAASLDGPLVAYCWKGEQILVHAHFMAHD